MEHAPDRPSQSSLTACELLAECAKDLGNAVVWDEFYSRYRRKILTYLWRAFAMAGGRSEDFLRHADDWLQDVFTKLVQNDGHVVRSFRGTNDISVYAFLASIALSTVVDHQRSGRAVRRRAQLVSLEDLREFNSSRNRWDARITALLDLIDVEKALKTDEQSKNPNRDLLIFKLHFVEGLTAREIASIPGFNLTTSGLEKVLTRLRSRISRKDLQ
jgi:RNA polymerase sigma factor (sigma-70 family)